MQFVAGSSSDRYAVYNPANDSLVGEINLAGPEEVDAAVASAREAFESGSWSTYTGAQRAAVMNKLADLIDANTEELAKAEVQAMGQVSLRNHYLVCTSSLKLKQPIAVTSSWIIPACSSTWRYYAGWADKIEGQTFPEEGGFFRMTQYEPFGVCAGVGPWNVTLL